MSVFVMPVAFTRGRGGIYQLLVDRCDFYRLRPRYTASAVQSQVVPKASVRTGGREALQAAALSFGIPSFVIRWRLTFCALGYLQVRRARELRKGKKIPVAFRSEAPLNLPWRLKEASFIAAEMRRRVAAAAADVNFGVPATVVPRGQIQ